MKKKKKKKLSTRQQIFQEGVDFNPDGVLAPFTNQVAANFPRVEEEDWFN